MGTAITTSYYYYDNVRADGKKSAGSTDSE